MRNNFVSLIDAFYAKMTRDLNISPDHIATYLALVNLWTLNSYSPTFIIKPEEIIAYAKLESFQELRACLKYLEKAKYIKTYSTRIPTNGIGIKLISLYKIDKNSNQNNNRITKYVIK